MKISNAMFLVLVTMVIICAGEYMQLIGALP